MTVNEKRPYYEALVREAFRHARMIPDEHKDVFYKIIRKCETTQVLIKNKWILWHGLKDIGGKLSIAKANTRRTKIDWMIRSDYAVPLYIMKMLRNIIGGIYDGLTRIIERHYIFECIPIAIVNHAV